MNRTLIETLISGHEGCRYAAYKDTLGNFTVGIGFDLDAPGAEEVLESFGIDYQSVCNGNLALTPAQTQQVFEHSVNVAIFVAQCQIANFSSLPDEVQAVCVDLAFDVGSTGLSKFVKFIGALAEQAYAEAALELKNSLWCTQVATRCSDDCSILEKA